MTQCPMPNDQCQISEFNLIFGKQFSTTLRYMKQKEVFKKIGQIIQELSGQYEYLQTVTDDLNDLELELFVSNAHFLTDHIEILCKLNLQKGRVKPPAPIKETYEKKFFEPVVQQMKQTAQTEAETLSAIIPQPAETENNTPPEEQPVPEINLEAATPEDTYAYIREEPEIIRHELIIDESEIGDDDDDDEYRLNENQIPRYLQKRENSTEILSQAGVPEDIKAINKNEAETKSTTEGEVVTINQKISTLLGDKNTAHGEQLSLKPISDIKQAITLNDKLLYVKELFNGYNLAYSEAIEILNRFNTFEEAALFLKTNYVTKNNWESKPAVTDKFYALLKRRYL